MMSVRPKRLAVTIKFLILMCTSSLLIGQVRAAGVRIKRSIMCSNENPASRTDCGWPGITERQCRLMDCCYQPSSYWNNCFIGRGGLVTLGRSCDFSKPYMRQDCGYSGITKSQCEARNCCFDNRVSGVHHCFVGGQNPTTTSNNNGGGSYESTESPLKVLYAKSGTKDNGHNYAHTGFAQWEAEHNYGDLVFAKVEERGEGNFYAGAGLLDHKGGSKGLEVGHKILTVSGEVSSCNEFSGKCGAMGRAAAIDGTLYAGPVNVNYGLVADTGFMIDKGVEVKVLGVGGKIASDGIEACFIVCIGFSW